MEGLLSRLAELGLSEYEAKTYLALLAHAPASAYETAKRAGIPSSKIYQVLDKMRLRGLVLCLEEEPDKRLYLPEAAADFIDGQRARMGETLEKLSSELSGLGGLVEASALWNLKNREALITKALAMISRARVEILLSALSEDIEALSSALFQAQERGARIAIIHFGEQRQNLPGIVYPHPIKDTLQEEKGGRGFSLVCDSQEALSATIKAQSRVEGAYSRNSGFVVLAEDYIKHDIYVMKFVRRYEDELISRFGPGFQLLRDVFSDTEFPRA